MTAKGSSDRGSARASNLRTRAYRGTTKAKPHLQPHPTLESCQDIRTERLQRTLGWFSRSGTPSWLLRCCGMRTLTAPQAAMEEFRLEHLTWEGSRSHLQHLEHPRGSRPNLHKRNIASATSLPFFYAELPEKPGPQYSQNRLTKYAELWHELTTHGKGELHDVSHCQAPNFTNVDRLPSSQSSSSPWIV